MKRLAYYFIVSTGLLALPVVTQAQSPVPAVTRRVGSDLSASFRKAADRAMPAIVMLETISSVERDGAGPVVARFGDGTGLVVRRNGWILTNRHVVADASAIVVRLADGQEYWAEEVREDEWSDLALLSVQAKDLPVATFAESEKVELGDWVVAAGNSFGLGPSVNAGTVNASRRRIHGANLLLLQTNAISNPGMSGGPLLNLDGEVVGICEGAYSEHGGFEGMSFAIPGNVARFVVDELLNHKTVRWPYLGISFESLSPRVAEKLGLKATQLGAIVTRVIPKTTSDQAGIRVADVITAFGGESVQDEMDLVDRIHSANVKTPVEVRLLRDGQQRICQVTPQLRPKVNVQYLSRNEAPIGANTSYTDERVLGVTVSELKADDSDGTPFPLATQGVRVQKVTPGKAAFYAGIMPGMVISHVGQTAVHNIQAFQRAVNDNADTRGVLVLVWASEHGHFVVIKEPRVLRNAGPNTEKPDTTQRPVRNTAR